MTTVMVQITREATLPLARGEKTRRRALLEQLAEQKNAVIIGQDNPSWSYNKSIAGTGPNTQEGRGK